MKRMYNAIKTELGAQPLNTSEKQQSSTPDATSNIKNSIARLHTIEELKKLMDTFGRHLTKEYVLTITQVMTACIDKRLQTFFEKKGNTESISTTLPPEAQYAMKILKSEYSTIASKAPPTGAIPPETTT